MTTLPTSDVEPQAEPADATASASKSKRRGFRWIVLGTAGVGGVLGLLYLALVPFG